MIDIAIKERNVCNRVSNRDSRSDSVSDRLDCLAQPPEPTGVNQPPSTHPIAGTVKTRHSFRYVALAWILCGTVGCTPAIPVNRGIGPAPRHEAIYVISGGWHTELALPVAALSGPLTALRPEFPSARYLAFGWGARDYYVAKNFGIGDLLRAAVPGPAVMLVIPLEISPETFFGASNVYALPAPPNGVQRLSQFLWDYLVSEENGAPRRIGTGPYPQSVFYASTGTYNLGHTCNTWTAEALRVAGLPVNAAGVVFAGQVLDQLPPILESTDKPVHGTH
jgi:uncharacterized protein (TIGR02117 family)